MGLYSQNRVASVVAESTTSNEAVNVNHCSLLEACISLHENDSKMFESLIELDFVSAVNESVLLEADEETAEVMKKDAEKADEAKKTNIKEKIQQILDWVAEKIKELFQNISNKLISIFNNDEALIKKYADVLKAENLKDFPGIKDFCIPRGNLVDEDSIATIENVTKFAEKYIAEIEKAEGKEAVDEAFAKCKEEISKKAEEQTADIEKFMGEKKEEWKPEALDLTIMKRYLEGSKEAIKPVKEAANKTLSAINELKRNALKNVAGAAIDKVKGGEVSVYKQKVIYDLASMVSKFYSKQFNQYINLKIKTLAAARKATIICGRYALKAVSGAEETVATGESFVDFIIGESSDSYIEECFIY